MDTEDQTHTDQQEVTAVVLSISSFIHPFGPANSQQVSRVVTVVDSTKRIAQLVAVSQSRYSFRTTLIFSPSLSVTAIH